MKHSFTCISAPALFQNSKYPNNTGLNFKEKEFEYISLLSAKLWQMLGVPTMSKQLLCFTGLYRFLCVI